MCEVKKFSLRGPEDKSKKNKQKKQNTFRFKAQLL